MHLSLHPNSREGEEPENEGAHQLLGQSQPEDAKACKRGERVT